MRETPPPGTRLQVAAALTDLRDRPGGARLRQALRGDVLEVETALDGWLAVVADKDGYRGVVDPVDLVAEVPVTHQVSALATHFYTRPDIKAAEAMSVSFGARLRVEREVEGFGRTHDGFNVPLVHLTDVRRRFRDPAAVAELFLGTPYLWGGNSRLGIDCSGLVQAACRACGLPCPGDSGDQARSAGAAVAEDAPLARGDLVFWRGHVAMAVSGTLLIHANAHHMAVVYEEAEAAVRRISAQGGGSVTARRRLPVA